MLNLDLWKLLLDLKSIASDILRYIFEPAEWIRYIAIYFNLPSECDTWPADKPPIYLQKSFISIADPYGWPIKAHPKESHIPVYTVHPIESVDGFRASV